MNQSPGKRPHRTKPPFRLSRFLRDYWIELAAGLAGLLGLALTLFDRNDVSVFGNEFLDNLRQNYFDLSDSLRGYLKTNYSLTDLAGLAIGAMALAFILWRVRVRLSRSPRLRAYACPRCGSDLRRVHRTSLDRLVILLFFPPGRRYACANRLCGWTGLLRKGQHSRRPENPPQAEG